MGNIKHNDELLRVHDDGFDVVFNCDNKHQNGVSYHAEKNGKKTKIDPEYAMAALVKKVSGAGWPADLPVPSAGGYGYTDPVETEKVFEYNYKNVIANFGQMIMNDKSFLLEEGQLYNVTVNNQTYTNCPVYRESNPIQLFCGDLSEDMPFKIMTSALRETVWATCFTFPTDGDRSVKVEKILGQEIHKIDEKYLPENGVGYDEISEGNITEIDGKKYLTPLGGGIIRKPLNVEFTMTSTEDGITWGEEPIFDGYLSIGDTYKVTVNGVANDYICYIDDYNQKIIGTFEDDMTFGDWQIADYGDGIYANIFGEVGDEFNISVNGESVQIKTVDISFVPNCCRYKIVPNENGYDLVDMQNDEKVKTSDFFKVAFELHERNELVPIFVLNETVLYDYWIYDFTISILKGDKVFRDGGIPAGLTLFSFLFNFDNEYVEVTGKQYYTQLSWESV